MKYFTRKELERSAYAQRHGIENTMNEEQWNNMKDLVENLLDPLRKLIKYPITVNSGFRNTFVNIGIGGSDKSDHTCGRAVDIECNRVSNIKLGDTILKSGLPFDKLIYEFVDFTGKDKSAGWIHVSYNSKKNRGLVYKAYKGKNQKTLYRKIDRGV